MPAYTVPLANHSCRQCASRATVEVFNTRNASNGYYCTRHGNEAVRDLDRLTEAGLGTRPVGKRAEPTIRIDDFRGWDDT